jgi:opacity protein-like surface antigen
MERKLFPLLLLTSALALPAGMRAQNTAPNHEPVPPFEFYGGYSYVFSETHNATTNVITTSGLPGWDASLKVPVPLLPKWIGVKGDVSGSYYNSDNNNPDFNPKSYYFLLGPQVSTHLGRSTVFLHGLVGSAHVSQNALPNLRSSNTFAVAVGAGLDAGFSRHWAWRVTGDYYNTHYHATDQNVREILNSHGRIATGPVLRF